MFNLKSLLSYLLVLAMSFAITACDDCDEEEGGAEAGEEAKADGGSEEGGSEGGEECPEGGESAGGDAGDGDDGGDGDGDGGDDDGGEVSYNYLVLVDNGNSDEVGTSGADVYGVSATCDDGAAALTFDSAGFGASSVCTATGQDCVCRDAVEGMCGGTDRGDTGNILGGSEDAYYSMGNGGHAILSSDKNLDGCSVAYMEVKMDEEVTAYGCTSAESNPAESGDCIPL